MWACGGDRWPAVCEEAIRERPKIFSESHTLSAQLNEVFFDGNINTPQCRVSVNLIYLKFKWIYEHLFAELLEFVQNNAVFVGTSAVVSIGIAYNSYRFVRNVIDESKPKRSKLIKKRLFFSSISCHKKITVRLFSTDGEKLVNCRSSGAFPSSRADTLQWVKLIALKSDPTWVPSEIVCLP